jgi:acetamidase/formamidase
MTLPPPRRLTRDQTTLYFDPRATPVIEIDPGEHIIVETADSLCGLVRREAPRGFAIDDVVERLGGACPVTGPIFVRGAAAGDVLQVHIERVSAAPASGTAWTGVFGGFGALSHEMFSLQPALDPITTLVSYSGDEALLPTGDRTARIPVRAFLGTVGVAPRRERRMSFSQSPEYLGDVDIPDLSDGATLVVPVNTPGALLSLGDAHAAQGDGEITGAALEIEADVELHCTVSAADEGGFVSLPQLNTRTTLGSVAGMQGNSLADCARAAYRDLVLRLVRYHAMPVHDAYQLLGQVGRLRVGNMIDPFYSVLASVDRSFVA